MSALEKAISCFKKQKDLADAIGVTEPDISRWKSRAIPAKHCRRIEVATKGVVTAEELRPDIFANPQSSTAA